MLNLIQEQEQIEKALLRFGNQYKHMKIKNGKKIIEELDKADAHPYGARPFKRENYINKFLILTEGIIGSKESDRFLKTVQNLRQLKSGQLDKLNIEVRKSKIKQNSKKGIF